MPTPRRPARRRQPAQPTFSQAMKAMGAHRFQANAPPTVTEVGAQHILRFMKPSVSALKEEHGGRFGPVGSQHTLDIRVHGTGVGRDGSREDTSRIGRKPHAESLFEKYLLTTGFKQYTKFENALWSAHVNTEVGLKMQMRERRDQLAKQNKKRIENMNPLEKREFIDRLCASDNRWKDLNEAREECRELIRKAKEEYDSEVKRFRERYGQLHTIPKEVTAKIDAIAGPILEKLKWDVANKVVPVSLDKRYKTKIASMPPREKEGSLRGRRPGRL